MRISGIQCKAFRTEWIHDKYGRIVCNVISRVSARIHREIHGLFLRITWISPLSSYQQGLPRNPLFPSMSSPFWILRIHRKTVSCEYAAFHTYSGDGLTFTCLDVVRSTKIRSWRIACFSHQLTLVCSGMFNDLECLKPLVGLYVCSKSKHLQHSIFVFQFRSKNTDGMCTISLFIEYSIFLLKFISWSDWLSSW
jgi:hypothetical protein